MNAQLLIGTVAIVGVSVALGFFVGGAALMGMAIGSVAGMAILGAYGYSKAGVDGLYAGAFAGSMLGAVIGYMSGSIYAWAKGVLAVGRAPTKTYQTYTKTNPTTGKVYSGRTSGTGTPIENVAIRDKYHHITNKGYGPAILDQSSTNYAAIRGREQMLIDYYGGAQSTGGVSGNLYNGIRFDNPNKQYYLKQALKLFGEI